MIVIASGAKLSILPRMPNDGLLRRFAPLRKRSAFVAGNDDGREAALPRRDSPGLCGYFGPLHTEGAGNAGRQVRPQPRVRKW
jgi:hypothetical protein